MLSQIEPAGTFSKLHPCMHSTFLINMENTESTSTIHKSENKFGLHKFENKFGLHKSENKFGLHKSKKYLSYLYDSIASEILLDKKFLILFFQTCYPIPKARMEKNCEIFMQPAKSFEQIHAHLKKDPCSLKISFKKYQSI